MRRSPRRLLPLALATGLLASGGAAVGDEPESRPPLDYIAQRAKLSQPIYPITLKETFFLTMADGERIYMEITRPDPARYPALGRVPVILEASPYHGTSATRIGDRIFPDPVQGSQALGLTGYFAPRGYAVAMMDLRGTGRSTGCLDHLGPNDASDMKAVVEWLASRDWSSGRVGMTGHSYVGSTPSVAAAVRPQGLVTIAPSAGLASMYDHQFTKGVPYLLQWVGPMVAYEWLAALRDLPPGVNNAPVLGGSSGDNWANGPNTQAGCGMQNSAALAGTGQVTGQYEAWHAARDWRDEVASVDIPIFMIHGVHDNAARIPAADWFFANRFDREGDKVWLGQWDHGSTNGRCGNQSNARVLHPTCRFHQWQYALHAWFDHHLQQRTWVDEEGNEHPIDTGPAVEVFTNGVSPLNVTAISNPSTWGTKVFTADAWRAYPMTTLYPDATNMSLGFSPPALSGSATYSGADMVWITTPPGSIHVGANAVFQSAPLQRDTLFVGLPQLRLEASLSNSQIAHLTAILYRENSAGQRTPMSFCAIQPMLRNGVDTVTPVVPKERMTLPMQCFTMAHWVPAGQHLELEFSTASPHHATFGAEAGVTVFTGPDATRLSAPEVPSFVLYDDVPLRQT
jgi:uncharacterized protein